MVVALLPGLSINTQLLALVLMAAAVSLAMQMEMATLTEPEQEYLAQVVFQMRPQEAGIAMMATPLKQITAALG